MSLGWRIIAQVNEEKGVPAWERKPMNMEGLQREFQQEQEWNFVWGQAQPRRAYGTGHEQEAELLTWEGIGSMLFTLVVGVSLQSKQARRDGVFKSPDMQYFVITISDRHGYS